MSQRKVRRMAALAVLAAAVLVTGSAGVPDRAAAAVTGAACSTAGTWQQGEVNVYWFDVEQGDAQLVVGPTGRTLLVDLGENAWNSTGANTNSAMIAQRIRQICGIASGPVHLDYVMASHHHLDHIGYSSNPNDTSTVGNGIYRLLTPAGEGFTVGTLIDRDGGTWQDANADGDCDVGTSTAPSNEIAWRNAGTTSQTARRWICWLYGPAAQPDRANIQGRVLTLANTAPWPLLDLGTGVTAAVVQANAKGVLRTDGTPVGGDHTLEATPPSENDYSVGLKITYGKFEYATAGDTDGEYATSGFGYTYNDVEASVANSFGNVETMRVNHHGSGHSSNAPYVAKLAPETAFISCGVNSYGHPSNRVVDALQAVTNERGTGADVYLANNPCDSFQSDGTTATDTSGTLNANGDIWLRTTTAGASYTVTHDTGVRNYVAYDEGPPPPPPADPSKIVVNEYLMAPQTVGTTEWIELYNPTAVAVGIGGLYLDDIAGGGAPKLIPAGTTIAANGRYVMDIASGLLNNTGTDSVRYLKIVGGVETVYDSHTYTLSSVKYDQVFHRTGDGGAWCNTISSNRSKGAANPSTCP